MPSRPSSFMVASPRRGIALLVTIILLSFLVLLMVAMSSLVRVETKVAANQDTIAQARQNALMGLNIAVAKLQETAGPDKRVTARADMFDTNAAVFPGPQYQMNLTGVWDTSGGGAPQLVTWLVNGNEDIEDQPPNITPDVQATAGLQRKNNSQILILNASDDDVPAIEPGEHKPDSALYDDVEPGERTFDPNNVVPGGSTAPDFSFGNGHVYLVANGSVDLSSQRLNGPLIDESYKHAASERVILRKSPIRVDGAKLNGKAAGSAVTVGHYAFWVGDAGVKASLSAANWWNELSYDDSAGQGVDYLGGLAATDDEYINRKMLNQLQLQGIRYDMLFRPGYELRGQGPQFIPSDIFNGLRVPDFMNNPVLNQVNRDRRSFYFLAAHPANWNRFQNMVTPNHLHHIFSDSVFTAPRISNGMELTPPPLLQDDNGDQVEDFRKIIDARMRQLFHDTTPVNYSVLTDMVNGGLRRDLSAAAVAGQSSGISTLPASLRPGVQAFTDVWRPGTALSQARRTPPATNKSTHLLRELVTSDAIPGLGAATDSAFPVAPVISEFEMTTALRVTAAGAVEVDVNIELELWNPYNATIELQHDLMLNTVFAHVAAAGTIENRETGGASPGPRNASPFSAQNTFNRAAFRATNIAAAPADGIWRPGEIKRLTIATQVLPAKNHAGVNIVGFTTAPTGGGTLQQRFTNVDQPTLDVELGYQILGVYRQISEYAGLNFPGVTNPSTATTLYYSFQAKNYDTENAAGGAARWPDYDPRGPRLGTLALRNRAGVADVGNAIQGAASYFDTAGDHFRIGQQIVLFDVPRQEILGVASLRHVVERNGAPVYRIGTHQLPPGAVNPNLARGGLAAGDNTNSIFETHFFSSAPRANATNWVPASGAKLPNTAMVVFDPDPNGLTATAEMLRDAGPPAGTSRTGIQSVNSAQYFLVRDTLNINSTSVAAWRGFLAGALPTIADPAPNGNLGGDYGVNTGSRNFDFSWLSNTAGLPYNPDKVLEDCDMRANWRYYDTGTDSLITYPVRNAFFRFSHTATDIDGAKRYDQYVTDLLNLAPAASSLREKAAFRIGLRELTRAQVEELSWWVVYYIKNRPSGINAPFRSLKEFIDEGILQIAIDTVGNPAYAPIPAGPVANQDDISDFPVYWPSRGNDRVPAIPLPTLAINPKDAATGADLLPLKSPSYFMQGDILELIGHRLFARSDTFTIRVYGDVNDPDGNGVGEPKILARVWLEATVQRTPIKHPTADDPDDNMTPTNPAGGVQVGNFGRQFRILSIRWLRPDEV